jgi:hypothetical protein
MASEYLPKRGDHEPPKRKGSKKEVKQQAELIDQVTRQLRSAFEASHLLRLNAKEDIQFLVGGHGQWKADDVKQLEDEKRPVMSFNNIHPIVNLLCGIEEDRHQDRRYLPKGSEDEYIGRIATIAVKNLEDQGARWEESKQFRLGVSCGLSVLKVYHSFEHTDDYVEGDIKGCALETNTWYCDPRARIYNRIDARYQGELMWMDADEIDEMWPGHHQRLTGLADWLPYEPSLTGIPDSLLRELYDKEKDLIRVLRHYYRVPVTVTLLINRAAPPDQAVQRVKDGKTAEAMIQQIYDQAGAAAAAPFQVYQTNQAHVVLNQRTGEMMPVMTPDEGMQAIDQIRVEAGRQAASQYEVLSRDATALRCAHLTGWELLDDTPFEDFDGWRFPYSPFICFQDSDSLDDIKGVVRDLKDPQREINWHHSTMVDTLNRAPKGQIWFNKGDNQDLEKLKKKLSRPGFAGEYTTTPPTYFPPGAFSPGDLAMVEFGLDSIFRISNVNASMVGQDTQKTVSGRARLATQSGGLVGLGSIFANWQRTKEYTGLLYIKAIQQHYSPEKLDRIIGMEGRMAELLGVRMPMPAEQMYVYFKQLRDVDMDVKCGFQEATQVAREANFNRLMQLAGVGFPVPPELLLETADAPYKEEIKLKVQQQGMQQPNDAMLQALGASQGQGANAGINTSQ